MYYSFTIEQKLLLYLKKLNYKSYFSELFLLFSVRLHRTNEEKLLLITFFVTFNISFAHPKLLMDRDADTVLQIKQRICMTSVVKYQF